MADGWEAGELGGGEVGIRIAQPPRQTRSAKILARPRFYLARVGFILRLASASLWARALVIPKADKTRSSMDLSMMTLAALATMSPSVPLTIM